jgi:flagellar biosynthesis protein FlhB
MIILNLILYKPLISLVNKRNENILDNLSKASEIILITSNMTNKYEESLLSTKKEAKQEAKQEFKEREGDPQLKARVRAVQRDMARKRMMDAVKKADAIITNPTHIAVAIVYDKDSMAAPKVVAKGADFLAERIKKIATEAGVPLVENVALARTLFKTVKVGKYIPRALYQAVADVLTYVYRLKGRIPGRSGV